MAAAKAGATRPDAGLEIGEGQEADEGQQRPGKGAQEDGVDEAAALPREHETEAIPDVHDEVGNDEEQDSRGKLARQAVSALAAEREAADAQQERHEADWSRGGEVVEEPREEAADDGAAATRGEGDRGGKDQRKVGAAVAKADVGGDGKLQHRADDGREGDAAGLPVLVRNLHRPSLAVGVGGAVRGARAVAGSRAVARGGVSRGG